MREKREINVLKVKLWERPYITISNLWKMHKNPVCVFRGNFMINLLIITFCIISHRRNVASSFYSRDQKNKE